MELGSLSKQNMPHDTVQTMDIVCVEGDLDFIMFFGNHFGKEAVCQAVSIYFDSWFTGKLLLQSFPGIGQLLFH